TLLRRPAWWERRLWGYEGEWLVYGRPRGGIRGYPPLQGDRRGGPWEAGDTVDEVSGAAAGGGAGPPGPPERAGGQGGGGGPGRRGWGVAGGRPADTPWAARLADAANLRGELKLGVLRSAGHAGYGAMLRVLDVESALEQLPVAPSARGECLLEVRDEMLPAN